MEEDKLLSIEKTEGRRRCPSCSEEKKNMLHESTDKKRIISDYPRVYGKKYRCGQCGQEWKEN